MKLTIRLLCLLLVLTTLLSGCSFRILPSDYPDPTDNPPSTAPTEAPIDFPTQDPAETHEISVPEVERAIPYSDITYERPDAEPIIAFMDAITAEIEANEVPAAQILEELDEFDRMVEHFDTMQSYAYVRYCTDLSDSYYDDEYNFLNDQLPLIQAAYERAAIAAVSSPDRSQLEEYFTAEELEFYEDHRVYTNDAFIALSLRENALIDQFMTLQDSKTIIFEGEERNVDELTAEYADDSNTLLFKIYPAYYEKYNQLCGELYVELIQVRREMAQVAGYDSYQDYMFDFYYKRDYTPDQAGSYVRSLISDLLPTLEAAEMRSYDAGTQSVTMEQAAEVVLASLQKIDPEYAGYFRFMQNYGLWDVSTSSSKMPGSYETYFADYDSPFVYISPTGEDGDISTLAHEFGHFVDSMHNDNEDICLDQCETFSQGMEYLNLLYSNLPQRTVDRLLDQKMVDALSVFVYQGLYAEFEDRVYRLENPTLEDINRTYAAVMADYDMVYGIDWYDNYVWIDINHFFEAPCYIISYCTSADAAFQLFTMEQEETGAGVKAYRYLLENTVDHGFLELLELCGMESPFQPGRSKELARQFQAYLR